VVSRQHRANRKRGAGGERAALAFLNRLGFRSLMPLKTGFTISNVIAYLPKGKVRCEGFHDAKVSGDFFGLDTVGRGCLFEVKTVDKLGVTCFKSHQLPALREWNANGGHAFIVWICPGFGTFLIHPDDIIKGKPMSGPEGRIHCRAQNFF
jgi:hypothetical protein